MDVTREQRLALHAEYEAFLSTMSRQEQLSYTFRYWAEEQLIKARAVPAGVVESNDPCDYCDTRYCSSHIINKTAGGMACKLDPLKPYKYFIGKRLPSRRALPMPKLTRLGWNGMCYVEMKNGIVYSRKEVDAWLRRYMSKETRA